MSLTARVWDQVKDKAKANGGAIAPKDLFPLWNAAMKMVHEAGKIEGAKNTPAPDQVVPADFKGQSAVDAQLEILELLVLDMKNEGKMWTSCLAKKPSTLL